MFDFNSVSTNHNLISIDLPGHGFTPGPALTSIEDHTDFCIKVLSKLGITKPIIAGRQRILKSPTPKSVGLFYWCIFY